MKKIIYGLFIFLSFVTGVIAVCEILSEEKIQWNGVLAYAVISAASFIVAVILKRKIAS